MTDTTELEQILRTARESGDFEPLMGMVPYAALLGVGMQLEVSGEPLFHLPPREENIGNTMLPALHGGVIGGLLEHSAILHLMWTRESLTMPKTIDFNIDYLRSAKLEDTWCRCRVTRQGSRVAHVQVDCWQQDPARPVAVARAHFLLS